MKHWRSFGVLALSLNITYADVSERCARIVSLSPTITDTLLSLGLAKNIVGGTRYDLLPKDQPIADIGGTLDPNYEAILRLSPSIVFSELSDDSPQSLKLAALQLPTEHLSFRGLKDVHASTFAIGNICGIHTAAEQKVNELDQALAEYKSPAHRTLIFYTYQGQAQNVLPTQAVGPSFHQELMTALGWQNAYQGALNAPMLSTESVLTINPDLIILMKGDVGTDYDPAHTIMIERISPAWRALETVPALQKQQVFEMTGNATFMASPDGILATLKAWRSISEMIK